MNHKKTLLANAIIFSVLMNGCSTEKQSTNNNQAIQDKRVPASQFDLSHWLVQIPVDLNNDHKADTYDVDAIQTYSHPDYFYLNKQDNIVFVSPNKAATSKTSTNTRSEMRYMSRGKDTSIAEKSPANNFSLASHPNAEAFPSIGTRMEATLHVDHVSENAGHPHKYPAYSVVIGQIHAAKLDKKIDGFGYGNEPLKIFYKKWPNHKTGSVFWTYERNLPKDDPQRIDIAYPVWGNNWDNDKDPNNQGIALGEEFSYVVNVYQDTMYLTFKTEKQDEQHFKINLANNIDAHGLIDTHDHLRGYANEPLYFKAGVYNQCSTKISDSFRYPACPGTGNWPKDREDGNYAQATFSKLTVEQATPVH